MASVIPLSYQDEKDPGELAFDQQAIQYHRAITVHDRYQALQRMGDIDDLSFPSQSKPIPFFLT